MKVIPETCCAHQIRYLRFLIITQRVLLVEQCLITRPEHLSPPSVFCGVHIAQSLVVCVVILDRCLKLVHFRLLNVLSVLPQLMASEYLFGIF